MTSTTAVRHSVVRMGSAAVFAWLIFAALVGITGYPEAAVASCAEIQVRSANAFTGVVLATRSRGRVATVRTDAGATVEVVGTPSPGSAATSVDRTYEVGARYEFHPLNGASPYQDNACTATRLLSSTAPSAAGSESAGTGRGWIVPAAGGLVLLGAGGALLVARRRRAKVPSGSTAPGQQPN